MVIDTLVEDIQKLLVEGSDELSQEAIDEFGKAVASVVASRLKREERKPTLRMSNIGQPCERKLWYELNLPEEKEPLPADAIFKFLFGDLIEETMLFLASASGHKVEGRQSEQSINGIKGHRDAVIDGVLVDVKSASSYSYKKFKDGKLHENDAFGYITQIQSYSKASQDDAVVTDHGRVAFLVADKTLGHICLDVHETDKKFQSSLEEVYTKKQTLVEARNPPPRGFSPEPDGKSGNQKLPINCSYCPFKQTCHPGLRTFLSYKGPVYLTTVAREPKMNEVGNSNSTQVHLNLENEDLTS